MWATPMGGNRYRLENLPFFAYGMSFHDIVEAEPAQDGMLDFVRVVEKSGYRTIRVVTADLSPVPKELIVALNAMDVWYERADKSYIALNIQPEIDLDAVVAELMKCDSEAIQWEHVDPTYDELYPEEADSSGA